MSDKLVLDNQLNKELLDFIDSNFEDFSNTIQHKLIELRTILYSEIENPNYNNSVLNKSKQLMLKEILHRLLPANNIGLSVQITDKVFKRRIMVVKEERRPLAEYLNDITDDLWDSIDEDLKLSIQSIIHEDRRSYLRETAIKIIFDSVFLLALKKFKKLQSYATC